MVPNKKSNNSDWATSSKVKVKHKLKPNCALPISKTTIDQKHIERTKDFHLKVNIQHRISVWIVIGKIQLDLNVLPRDETVTQTR
ncbi:hypothetical protein VNO80_06336 [Phaseolus coccineus]|uniref:Uncharacterized protein n=1 Tax=Phaseolus coccineus TaxID=3886 RepID=A0AAN9NGP8_PHACN